VSPRFPPINAADMHRVRHSLPYFPKLGWRPIVLAATPHRVEGGRDEMLKRTVPSDTDVRHVRALPLRWTRRVKIGNIALRSMPFYARRGSQIIKNEDVDLVYFSTTAFPVLALGRYWKMRFGTPYVIDMQDPWYSGTYDSDEAPAVLSKARLARQVGRFLEPVAMGGVDALISVSQGYCDILEEQYERIEPSMSSVIPFGAAQQDFDVLRSIEVENPIFDTDSDTVDIVQVGRAGLDMDRAAHAVFEALAVGRREHPDLYRNVRMHFVGTRYSPQSPKTVEPIAAEYGVDDGVGEQPARVPYFQALKLLRDADMLVLLGSTDPNYTASKLYPYILAKKPLLAVFNEHSSVVDILHETHAGEAVTFNADTPKGDLAGRIYDAWRAMLGRLPYTPDTDWNAFQPYTAEAMTRKQVEVFDQVLDTTPLQ
jgi:hypothetical protein